MGGGHVPAVPPLDPPMASSGVMKIDPKREDYIARRCDTLNNDQLNEL